MARIISRFVKRGSRKVGLPPGTLEFVGEPKIKGVKITVIDYDEQEVKERVFKKIEDCFPFKDKPSVTWINIDGIHQVEIIEKIGTCFDIHPLVLEDIVHTGQRPKIEDFEDYIYIVLRMLNFDEKTNHIKSEQASLILGKNYVISFQEEEGDVFDPVRQRIRSGKGHIRKMGPDYLAYALLDVLVDNYFLILERIGERIEELEEELVDNPEPETLQSIYTLKRETIFMRKSIWPLREVVSSMQKSDSELIAEETGIFLKDVYDHTIQVIDTIETYRDVLSGLLDLYMSSISNKMNQVMQVLTIIATIFIPLTFIAGIYGMNFDPDASPFNMPELGWYWGYLSVWILMIIISGIMIIYFKRKKWF